MSVQSSYPLRELKAIEQKLLWLSSWMIHHANHLRPQDDDLKVGGHQASCASSVSLLTALYFAVLKPADRVAVKPHASPVFHAIKYLFGNQTLERLKLFRSFGGAQAYPSRTKDHDDVDFSTGSVGLGAAFTAFASFVQDYLRARKFPNAAPEGRMVALVGDAELDEGNIYECLLEGWKHGLRNTWWIIDYNRQSLDGIVSEGLYQRIEEIFRTFGWDVVVLKHGELQRRAFLEPGGETFREWIDACPNPLYSALAYQGGAAWRQRLLDDLGDNPDIVKLIGRYSDNELAELMSNLGGHCLPTLLDAFANAAGDRPTCFIAYTIKGWGLPLAGHKDNHSGIMTPDQMNDFRSRMGIRPNHEWDLFEGLPVSPDDLQKFVESVPFNTSGERRHQAPKVSIPAIPRIADTTLSTQAGFGKILHEIARANGALADRILTMSPDVTVSTNLGPWVSNRNLFSHAEISDVFQEERVVSGQKWTSGPNGQHFELGIAESNLFLLLGAAGLSHSLFGERLLPIGTIYDAFIGRGLDALNYACYQDARFMLVATPSGVTLAPEGGAHQSIGIPLLGMAQDGLAAFEPAFVDELSVIMEWSFNYMQRDGQPGSGPDERSWLRDAAGGSVYIRCTTRRLEQPKRELDIEFGNSIINGAYWMREPGPNCELVIAYQGVVAPEAIAAAGLVAEDRRDVGLLAVTSADRLNAGWQAAQLARARGNPQACSHIEQILGNISRNATIITVHDAHPATLSWIGGVKGHRVHALGVEHFGQSGSIPETYRHHEIDARAILNAANSIGGSRSVRYATQSIP
jgi:pyruvate dehydrogenase E1 component